MRLVEKQPEPATMVTVRTDITTNLETTASARDAFGKLDKDVVRKQLCEEQRSLCAFCMKPIDPEARDGQGVPTMKIAHRIPIAADSQLALTWTNLLGSCDGGERSRGRYWTCDAAQGHTPLTVDPTTTASIAQLRYDRRGTRRGLFITSDTPNIRADVDQTVSADGRQRHGTLALNSADLPELREQAWYAFREFHRRRHPKAYGKPALREFFPKWLAEHGVRLSPYVGVIEWQLAE